MRVRDLQSYWTNKLTYLNMLLGNAKVRQGTNEALLTDLRQRVYLRINRQQPNRRTRDWLNAAVNRDDKVIEAIVKVERAKANVELVQSLITSAEKIIASASREQSWRQIEISKYYGRQGQGT